MAIYQDKILNRNLQVLGSVNAVQGYYVGDLQVIDENGNINVGTKISFSNGEYISDNNGNKLIQFGVTANAVSAITVTNAATQAAPTIGVVSTDTNVPIALQAKGTAPIVMYSADAGATGTQVLMTHVTASPAISDEVGSFFFNEGTSIATLKDYAKISVATTNVTGSSEAGTLTISAATAGALVAGLAVSGTTVEAKLPLYQTSTDTLTGAGAVSLTTQTTVLVTTGANALTLAAGTEGQTKRIVMLTDGGDGTLTVTNALGFTTIVFNDVGDSATLYYTNSKWFVQSNFGCTIT